MKLFDCFLFNGELDLLEIRLNILSEYVDKFVILECEETFSGNPKPLYFEQNSKRFEKFADQIISLIAPRQPDLTCPWSREHYCRNNLIEGLKEARWFDFIMVSDCDEIPDPRKLHFYLTKISDPFVLQVRDHCYYLNCSFLQQPWIGPVIVRRSVIDEMFQLRYPHEYALSDVGIARLVKIRNQLIQIPLGGWHYSYLMSNKEIDRKIRSFSHYKELESVDLKKIDECREKLIPVNFLDKRDKIVKYEMDEENTSRYVLDNYDRLKSLGYILD